MPNIANALKAEIARVARKEVRSTVDPLRKSAAQQRHLIAALRKKIDMLERDVRRARKGAEVTPRAVPADGDEPRRRFSAGRLAKHRAKLGLSAADFGRLVGVSGQTVYKWEQGSARPRAAQLEALASVRGIGKREAAGRLSGANA